MSEAYARIIPLTRPVQPPIDRSREYTQDELAAHARYVAERKARRDEFAKTWTPPYPEPADPESEASTVWGHIESAAFDCWEMQRAGKVAAATAPRWVDHVTDLWLTSLDGSNSGIFEKAATAVSMTLPFLMEGGEFSLTFQGEKYREDRLEPIGINTRVRRAKQLRVKSEHGIHFGEMRREYGEMNYNIVVLPGGTPQDVADRVAAAYSKIVTLDMPTDYPAVMPLRADCVVCGRAFTDAVSRVIGLGPVCSRRLGLPHSPEAANKILERRKQLLAEDGAQP